MTLLLVFSVKLPEFLPDVVYIDRFGTYNLRISVRGNEPEVQFRMSDSRFLSLDVGVETVGEYAQYDVMLTDLDHPLVPTSPGTQQAVSFLSITIPTVTACDAVQWPSLTDTMTVRVLNGCPPGYQVMYNYDQSTRTFDCIDPDPSLPCIDYEKGMQLLACWKPLVSL